MRANVLLLVTGGIAAYKSCLLARLLVQAGFSVRVAMTDSAQRFVGPVTFRSLTGHGVATDLWGEGDTDPLDHVELARWADLAVVAPATANCLGKLAHGIADDMVTTQLLAFEGPLLLAPAMNDAMWRHPAVQANLALLRERGALVIEPGSGWLACGTVAEGRMAEPEEIFADLCELDAERPDRGDAHPERPLTGRRVVVTAGPTREPLDAIRYLSNRSTGAFGTALARQAAALGAEVVLIHGPLAETPPRSLGRTVAVETAEEMAEAVAAHLAGTDLLIMNAAVADFTAAVVTEGKIKKETQGDTWSPELTRTRDILAEVVDKAVYPDLTVVGFCLETEDLVARAVAKRAAKGMDFIVANDPVGDGTFGDGAHKVTLVGPEGPLWEGAADSKCELAVDLLLRLAEAVS